MNQVEKLLSTFCPNGVPAVKIDHLIDYEQPTKYLVASKTYNDVFSTPVLTAGQTFLLGYTNEEHGKYPASPESPVIIFDDFTTAYKWVDFEFKVKSSAMKMLTVKPGAQISLRYFWYALSTIRIDTSEHARYWISKFSNIEIQIPPMEIQQEIVRILDKFTELEVELQAELEARRLQSLHFKNSLLKNQSYPRTKLGEVVEILDHLRKPVSRDKREAGLFPYYGANGIQGYVKNFIFDGTFLLMGEDGSVINPDKSPILNWAQGRIWVNNHAHVLKEKKSHALLRFIYYALQTTDVSRIVRGMPPKINQGSMRAIEIPLPNLQRQHFVIEVLDSFNELEAQITTELNERRLQYEYYRSKLLTFKDLDVA